MRRLPALLALAALSLGFAPAPFLAPRPPAAAGGGLQAMQGEWTMTACTAGGAAVPVPGPRAAVFAGGRCEFSVNGAVYSRWRLTLDSTRSPGVLRFVGEARPAEHAGRVLQGRYRLEGDTLSIFWQDPKWETPPPETKPGAGVTVHVYKRKKP